MHRSPCVNTLSCYHVRMARTTTPAGRRPGELAVRWRRSTSIEGIDELAAAIRTLQTTDEVTRFLRDLCTRAELEALAHRWQTAQLLDEGVPYLEIAERVPTSTATVTRVAQWVRHGTGGYRVAFERRCGDERVHTGRRERPAHRCRPGQGTHGRADASVLRRCRALVRDDRALARRALRQRPGRPPARPARATSPSTSRTASLTSV